MTGSRAAPPLGPQTGGTARRWPALARFLRGCRGSSAMEFVVMFPLLFTLICVMLDMALMMSRYVLVERAVDQVLRQLRLGTMTEVSAAAVRGALQDRLCSDLDIGAGCSTSTTVELTRIDRRSFALPAAGLPCVSTTASGAPVVPVTHFVPGQKNDLMLIRVCVKVRTMTPAATLGLPVAVVAQDGSYAVSLASFFVVEPS